MVRPQRMAAEKAMTRYIRQSEWEHFREPITRLWLGTELPLKEIREQIQREYLFDATTKQWKDQLSKWQLKRHLNVTDAAHILRLIRQAEAQHIHRRVKFNTKEKRLSDILNYIARSQSVRSEAELLQQIRPEDSLPPYIFYSDAPAPTFLQVNDYNLDMSSPESHPISSTESLTLPPAQHHLASGHSSPLAGAQISPSWSLLEAEPVPDNQTSPSFIPISAPLDTELEDVDLLASLETCISQSIESGTHGIGYDSAIATIQPFERPGPGTSDIPVAGFFHGLMSLTPFVTAAGRRTQQSWDSLPDTTHTILGNNANCKELNSMTDTSYFITHCILACISRGQEREDEAEGLMASAIRNFENVLEHQFMDCLTVLTNLVTLFESYGQKEMAMDILGRVLLVFQANFGGSDPFSETVNFMMNTQAGGNGIVVTYDAPKLKEIHSSLVQGYGSTTRLSLTALFNVAWALTEMGEIRQARSILLELKTSCEQIFGIYHLQTISCIALLARVHIYNQEAVTAESLLNESVLGRVQKVFSSSHPYFWEIKNRHAIFLRILSERTGDAEEKRAYLDRAEIILHEVLLWRFTILGSPNPRTQFTFKILKKLLASQGKELEADNLFQWCAAGYQQNLLCGEEAITKPS